MSGARNSGYETSGRQHAESGYGTSVSQQSPGAYSTSQSYHPSVNVVTSSYQAPVHPYNASSSYQSSSTMYGRRWNGGYSSSQGPLADDYGICPCVIL